MYRYRYCYSVRLYRYSTIVDKRLLLLYSNRSIDSKYSSYLCTGTGTGTADCDTVSVLH
jgi:hypothetical protein